MTRPQRSREARALVIERSSGRCENPECGNPGFAEQTPAGEPILEVDHIHDLALEGLDHPANMIALCPNCHAVKTRGARGEQLREVFKVAARARHAAAMTNAHKA
ncbi:HNH endonuclease [Streptomyces montanus]|nr:HNH endonuclease signature motif containing protein [Streptomyces montanus]